MGNPSKAPWHKRNPFVRKGLGLLMRFPRATYRLVSDTVDYQQHPPLLANSFPKSGTHLLHQILQSYPGANDYGTFLASMPSIRYVRRSDKKMARKITALAPRELARGHLEFSDLTSAALRDMHVVHYFIYRDPRDVAISEAHYLTSMNRWHRLHSAFAALPDTQSRVEFAIRGADTDFPVRYPDIATRFSWYEKWLADEDVYSVRFEDLQGERREDTVNGMVDWFLEKSDGGTLRNQSLATQALEAIDPAKSHTYRKGRAGGWREIFEPAHKYAMKEVAGDLLVRLGYEEDLDW